MTNPVPRAPDTEVMTNMMSPDPPPEVGSMSLDDEEWELRLKVTWTDVTVQLFNEDRLARHPSDLFDNSFLIHDLSRQGADHE